MGLKCAKTDSNIVSVDTNTNKNIADKQATEDDIFTLSKNEILNRNIVKLMTNKDLAEVQELFEESEIESEKIKNINNNNKNDVDNDENAIYIYYDNGNVLGKFISSENNDNYDKFFIFDENGEVVEAGYNTDSNNMVSADDINNFQKVNSDEFGVNNSFKKSVSMLLKFASNESKENNYILDTDKKYSTTLFFNENQIIKNDDFGNDGNINKKTTFNFEKHILHTNIYPDSGWQDLNNDGKYETEFSYFAANSFEEFSYNNFSSFSYDSDHDGFIDKEKEYYKNGALKSIDYDSNGDGYIDAGKEYYKNGSLKSARNDINGDGNYESYELYDEAGVLREKESDNDSDGIAELYEIFDESGNLEQKQCVTIDNNKRNYENYIIYPDGSYKSVNDNKIIYDKIKVDGVLGDVQQNKIGDCWLLSTLNGLSRTQKGAQAIKDAIKVKDDGNYSVTFQYWYSPVEIEVTKDEMKKAKESEVYLRGDDDMLLLEIAYDKYFEKYKPKRVDEDEAFYIEGGLLKDAIYPLFGCDSTIITVDDEKSIDKALDRFAKNSENKVYFIGFTKEDEEDTMKDIYGREIKLGSNHAWSLESVDIENNTVTMINPWDTDVKITVDRYDFLEKADMIQYYHLK